MAKRLYRSRSDSMLAGVCGGLGDYFDLDANLIRLLFVLFSAVGGAGVLAYVALWLIVPVEGSSSSSDVRETIRAGAEEMADRARSLGQEIRTGTRTQRRSEGTLVFGALLILVGVVFLLRNLGVSWIGWRGFRVLWPSLVILAGIVLFWRRFNSEDRS